MQKEIPNQTIQAVARSIFNEASSYGFGPVDVIRLINELMDLCKSGALADEVPETQPDRSPASHRLKPLGLPLEGERVKIRKFHTKDDLKLLQGWLPDKYGRFFVLSCATAQTATVENLASSPLNHLGIITLLDDKPIGAMAFLDYNESQRRAELRKLIGDPNSRGLGLAEEATRLWIDYGMQSLGLEKIYVSTLQTHIANIRLNERVGFIVEGLLQNEVCIDGKRYDVLRMGLCRK